MTAQDAAPDNTATQVDDVAGMKTARTGGVVRAGAVMAVATLVSRMTGFLSKVVLLGVLGAGVVNDAYTLANTLPNIIFELLIGGVLTSVAIPLLSRARSDPDGGELYTQRLMTTALVGLVVATVLAVLAAPLLTKLYLADNSLVDVGLANNLAYLLLPQIFFYGIAALFGAILNTKEKFGVPAWAPVANNIVVIGVGIGFFFLSGAANGTGDALSQLTRGELLFLGIGTTAGIVLQALVMVPALLRGGFRFRWRWGGDRRLLEAGQLMLWAVAYVLVSQAGYVVITNIASDNVAGGITLYAFASLLFQLPYGIIGVSILTAMMPRMSRHAAAGQYEEMKNDASLANRLSIVALTPVAAGIMVLAGALSIVVALYGRVTLEQTVVLGSTLAALALGLVPFAVTLVQMRVFYAMKDARTPTLINAIMVGVRIPLLILCASLDPSLIIPGLALATSISYLVGAIAGEIWLRARYGPMGTKRTLVTLAKMIVAGAAGAAAALLASTLLLTFEVDTLGKALVEILLSGSVGLLAIAIVAVLLKVEELVPLRNRIGTLLRRIFRRGSAIPGASSGIKNTEVQDTERGTLVGDDVDSIAAATVSMAAVGAMTNLPTSREQVAEPVPNDSGGPTVQGRAHLTTDDNADSQQHAVAGQHDDDPGATTVIPAAELAAGSADGPQPADGPGDPDDGADPQAQADLGLTTVIPAEQTLPVTPSAAGRATGRRRSRCPDSRHNRRRPLSTGQPGVGRRRWALVLAGEGHGAPQGHGGDDPAGHQRRISDGRAHPAGGPTASRRATPDAGCRHRLRPVLRRRPMGRWRHPDRSAVRRAAGSRRRHLDHRETVRSGCRGAPQRDRPRGHQSVAGQGELRRSGSALARHRARFGHPGPGHSGDRRSALPDAHRNLAAG